MKYVVTAIICVWGIVSLPCAAWPQGEIPQADRLVEQGDLTQLSRAIDLYLSALKANPDDFDAHWKCAKAHREYGRTAKRQNVPDWEKICASHGKAGMHAAEKAIALAPDRIEGHYYYGLNVGIYSDGVSILTALREGLKGKTQKSFERSYAMDRMFDDAGPILSLGRFWAVVPWPFKSNKKALKYYREYQKTGYFDGNSEAQIFLAEVLMQKRGKATQQEARQLLEKAARSEETYFSDWAKRLLTQMDGKKAGTADPAKIK